MESKRVAESLIKSYSLQHGVHFNTVRIAHAYGPTMRLDHDGRIMADLMADALAGRDITLKSRGEAIRAFIYITDAVLGLFTILFRGKPDEPYNLANETEPVTIKTLADRIASLRPGLRVVFQTQEDAGTKGYCAYQRTALDTSAIEKLGWSPKVSLEEGLSRLAQIG